MDAASCGPAPGDEVPDFALRNQYGETVQLEHLSGTPSVLMFYPFAFSRVCSAELTEIREGWSEISALGVRFCAISSDSVYTLRAYAEELGEVHFDLLSDFWPHGAVAKAFGAFDSQKGCPRRVTFVLNDQLHLHRRIAADFTQSRDLAEVLTAVREIHQL
ncbi:redoxin domain-containing protein [Nesterenkonia natronophila]|uniref:redoxin domain-containing protein n=1 Tax=Nesterenkonia natronophila TaxID=2174932 RepID=UPI001314EB62|nr:redoxin domain-containing protein [Nesterenkonia natronophila]